MWAAGVGRGPGTASEFEEGVGATGEGAGMLVGKGVPARVRGATTGEAGGEDGAEGAGDPVVGVLPGRVGLAPHCTQNLRCRA